MCSAAWTFQPGGYTLAFNRDEKWARLESLPPALEVDHAIHGICSRDAKAGGTWLFTNLHGITLALLNAYPGGIIPPPGQSSRGLIPLLAAQAETPAALESLLRNHAWAGFAPCRLLLISEDYLSLFSWDGHTFTKADPPSEPFLCSSSVRTEEVITARTARFRQIMKRPLVEILFDEANPDTACNIRASRIDGGTVSFALVEVTASGISFSIIPRDQAAVTVLAPRNR